MGVYFVTGGSSGIGYEIVCDLARLGHRVCAGYHSRRFPEDQLEEDLKERIASLYVDVNDADSIKEAVKTIEDKYGCIDGLVNCAGKTEDAFFAMMPQESWDSVIDTDLKSVYHTVNAVLPGMMSRGSGSIVNISSIAGEKGIAGQTNYCAAKAGLLGFTRALSKEVARMNIRVNAVAPGYIETDMIAKVKSKNPNLVKEIPLRRIGKPKDVAKAVCFLLGEDSSYITGTTIAVDGGLLA